MTPWFTEMAAADVRGARSQRDRLNLLYLVFAYLVWLAVFLIMGPRNAYTPVEALGATVPSALPAFLAQRWGSPDRPYHVWTLAIALLGAFGNLYSFTHP